MKLCCAELPSIFTVNEFAHSQKQCDEKWDGEESEIKDRGCGGDGLCEDGWVSVMKYETSVSWRCMCGCICVCVCVCVCERDSIFQPWPPRSPFTQTLLLIAHPNSLQPVAHDKTTEQNQISKQHCITVPRYHTECWLLKPRETKCRYSAAYREIYSPVANLRNLWRRRPRAWAHSVVENITRPIKKYKKQLRFY